ncbi:hypothetical protein AB2L57_09370 [Microbacterium sp. HA-8]|uniref:hypothetical protein n=1 Tax=Microbacterium sp. HA-8 TaxID=3234200 RepID=UPI0038F74938
MDDGALITWVDERYPSPIQRIVDRIWVPYLPEVVVEHGWWPLLVRLDTQLAAIDPSYRLRFIRPYKARLQIETIDDGPRSEEFARVLRAAVSESARTCETCGQPGRRRRFDEVLCDEDAGFFDEP